MQTIYKYNIDKHRNILNLPIDAEILSVAFQQGVLQMWVRLDTDAQTVERDFRVFATGEEIPTGMGFSYVYFGTAHTEGGLVFHVFECLY